MENLRRGHVVVVGSANMDLVVRAKRLPQPGETVLGGEYFQLPGGKGANQAVAAARLAATTYFLGNVGDDAFGDSLRADMQASFVRTELVKIAKNRPTGVALIGVDADGRNAILVAPGANADVCEADIIRVSDIIEDAAVLVAQLEVPVQAVTKAMQVARAADVCTILNPAPFGRGDSLPPELLKCVHVLVPNEYEAAAMLGWEFVNASNAAEAAKALRKLGPQDVIITLGAEGCLVCKYGNCELITAKSVTAVDTTAAGDCFIGALAASIAEGKHLGAAARFASNAAAYSVTQMGAQPSLPWTRDLENF